MITPPYVCDWALLGCIGAFKGVISKGVEQKGVAEVSRGAPQKKPRKIWVIHVNTRHKN
jgi:hypothetical protein